MDLKKTKNFLLSRPISNLLLNFVAWKD